MNSYLRILIILAVTLSSCKRLEWNNPFDSSCPKEIWTPTNFKAIQEGTTVKLTWSQPINNMSGFKITKGVGGAPATSLQDQTKGVLLLTDNALIGGKVHLYSIMAYAGNNTSNTVTTQVTPILTAGITTAVISAVTYNSVQSGGYVTTDGGAPITARGICWSTNQNPTIADIKTTNGTGTGNFTSSITGLSNNTTYYVRAYATNAIGTAYGAVNSVILYMNTPSTPIADIDGNVYKTVKIGDQTWMAENLKVTKYRNGNTIPIVTDYTSWANLTSGAYSDFYNDPNNGVIYGHLYNFYTVLDNRQLCPTGWHIPSDAEFTTLTNFLGGESVAGGKLKEVGTTHWNSSNIGADNISGFTGLAGGFRGDNGSFYYNVGTTGNWWSSTEYDANNGIYRGLAYNTTIFSRSYGAYFGKKGGCSIRCIKD